MRPVQTKPKRSCNRLRVQSLTSCIMLQANLLLAEENTKLTEVEKLTPIPAVMTEEAEKADTVEDIPLEKDMDKKDEPTETE